MPLILGFHTKYILNPSGMYFNPAEVMLMAFAILFKIPSAHCGKVSEMNYQLNLENATRKILSSSSSKNCVKLCTVTDAGQREKGD